ncbi:Hypothetical protein A7982_07042 [Minicystis rosea]|nr:Hypothetical protein A7982_07042 [Minicystis rosea]
MLRVGNIAGWAIGMIAVALAACGGNVDVATGGATGGGANPSSSSSGSSSSGSSSSASSSGAGGSGGVPPLECAQGEAAIVAVSASESRVVVQKDGVWTEAPGVVPSAENLTTYQDVYGHLGVFWIDFSDGPNDTHFKTTIDGTSFDAYDVQGWAPLAEGPLQSIGIFAMLGAEVPGETSIAYFDPDAFDWSSYLDPMPIFATSVVQLATPGGLLAVGLGPQHQLCDVQETNGVWGSVHCRDDVTVATGGEVPVTRPRAVTLPNGDVVVVYYAAAGAALAATTLHEGVWSAPEKVVSDGIGIEFAITETAKGDVVVGIVSTAGALAALRYAPGAGWSAPIPIDTGAQPEGKLGAAPGICGDDALLAYAVGFSQVRVARVRGSAAEAQSVGSELFEQTPSHVSITTRRPSPSRARSVVPWWNPRGIDLGE